MLGDATNDETALLSAIPYRANKVWLHRDPTLMPRRRDAWAAWNYIGERQGAGHRDITVSYWMNRLQNIDRKHPVFITLNPSTPPREELTFGLFDYSHPQFDAAAIEAQARLPDIQGVNNTWYCGAWTRYGFHEDGLMSGLAVAEMLGCKAPWDLDAAVRPTPVAARPDKEKLLQAAE